ncbi:histidinol-phosphatase [Vallitalea longa]|uniref:Histidinol-phosphatase n=1 Tax=Vallitalea longa TaxID=2936439 RepID=A0A9W5YH57_9FIRM|nr:PHP domain-containing protein [Vallitalea longa]GKX31078.1 histidinol-phosphatase [Vallitalea longa]
MIDMHVHLERGPYTKEWLMELVSNAVKRDIDALYLLEHSFRFVEFRNIYGTIIEHEDYGTYQSEWLSNRMQLELTDYKDFITKMREYEFPIEVRFGLEICYFPDKEEEIKKCISNFDWDFLTGSIHWIDGWGFDHEKTKENWRKCNIDKVYERYYKLMIQLVESRIFNILAHPDSIKCFDYYPTIKLTNVYIQLAKALKRNNVKAEFSSGLHINYGHGDLGLNKELLKILSEYEVDIVTASDAHRPEDVGKYIREAKKILNGSNK